MNMCYALHGWLRVQKIWRAEYKVIIRFLPACWLASLTLIFVQGSTLYHLASKSDIMEHMWDFISCATNAGVSFSPATRSLALITAHILTTFILLIIQVCWVPHSSASQLLSTLPYPAWGPRLLVLMESIFRLFCFLASHRIWLVEVPSSQGTAGEKVRFYFLILSLLDSTLTVSALLHPRSQLLPDSPSLKPTAPAKPLPLAHRGRWQLLTDFGPAASPHSLLVLFPHPHLCRHLPHVSAQSLSCA